MEQHVVAHEIAHMLLEHGSGTSPGELAALLAGVDVGRGIGSIGSVGRGTRGNAYATLAEYEAELLATMILTGGRTKGMRRRNRQRPTF
ncbi:hypothetical protein [Nocardia sp. CA-120079]|uniref:hypothetical protein n=1 Tax=Nocardia sp. CA-120079 TaxID=3239974 RepID=UPI003D95265B